MKKFLFTLAALLMATSAYAAEKFWVDAEPFLNATPGVEFEVPVHAQFDGMVSAWQMDLGTIVDGEFVPNVLPAGISVTYYDKGADMKIIYKNSRGRDADVTASLGGAQNDTRFISATSTSDLEYYQVDGAWVAAGVVKWMPGTYDEMMLLYFTTTEEYDGTPIAIRCAPTCGADKRDIPMSDGTTTVTPWYTDEPTPVQATEPTIDITGEYAKTITITGETGATLYYSFDNENWTLYEGPVTVSEAGNYTVYAYAVGPDNKTQSTTAEKAFTVTVYVPEQAQTPNIDITGEYAKTITITGETGATLYYSLDNENWYAYTAPIVVTEAGDYTVYAYAVGPQDKTQSVVAEKSFTVTVYVPGQAEKPVINVANDNTTEVTVTITGEAGAKLYYEVTPANRAYAEYTEALVYNTPGTYKITAYAVGPDDKTQSELAEATFTVKAPDQPTPAGSFTYESDWQNYYFNVTGDNAQLIIDGEAATTNTIERPAYGQDPITVSVQVTTNKGEGYTPTTTEAQTVTILPQLPEVSISAVPGQASADWIPGVGYDNIVEGNYYDVSFAVNANENDKTPYEIHYVITGPNGAKWEGVYDGEPIHLDKNGTYNVEAWAVYGEDAGKVATDSFKLDTNTGVNELVNGKTVAGVRYFNMAGQEMQEANGMTIVVTTYTDGTTSAVKVMK